jgi:CRP-like cAMP-binding protein
MPKSLQYKAGALIYYQGEVAERVMILHQGKISLVFKDIETGADMREQAQPGEFFGVKSALGHFPREENAIALTDVTIMALTVPEFEAMAIANTRITMKMLKVFSNQLRRIHAQVSSLLETENVNPERGLFTLGEKYLKNRQFPYAKYVFSRYLIHYPDGADVAQAEKNLKTAEASIPTEGKKPSTAKNSGVD